MFLYYQHIPLSKRIFTIALNYEREEERILPLDHLKPIASMVVVSKTRIEPGSFLGGVVLQRQLVERSARDIRRLKYRVAGKHWVA